MIRGPPSALPSRTPSCDLRHRRETRQRTACSGQLARVVYGLLMEPPGPGKIAGGCVHTQPPLALPECGRGGSAYLSVLRVAEKRGASAELPSPT